jgi:hypothetical protein
MVPVQIDVISCPNAAYASSHAVHLLNGAFPPFIPSFLVIGLRSELFCDMSRYLLLCKAGMSLP